MDSTKVELLEIKIVGITAKTNNVLEMDPNTANISPTLKKYFGGNLADKIKYRVKPGNTYCIYTEYESDENGKYTYFVGEQVSEFSDIGDFNTLTIPGQAYKKFTIGPGKMPETCIAAWQNIWKMNEAQLDGKRSYIADFEIYDERSTDPNNCLFDLYIGIK